MRKPKVHMVATIEVWFMESRFYTFQDLRMDPIQKDISEDEESSKEDTPQSSKRKRGKTGHLEDSENEGLEQHIIDGLRKFNEAGWRLARISNSKMEISSDACPCAKLLRWSDRIVWSSLSTKNSRVFERSHNWKNETGYEYWTWNSQWETPWRWKSMFSLSKNGLPPFWTIFECLRFVHTKNKSNVKYKSFLSKVADIFIEKGKK